MQTVITFVEHASKLIQADLGWEQNDPRLDQLERLNLESGDNLLIVGRKSIKATQYVGLIRLGSTTLQILPKIAYSGDFDGPQHSQAYQAAVRSAMHNLLVMLCVAIDLPLRAQDTTQLHSEAGDWLEVLTRLFTLELHRQFQAGLPHEYVRIEERLPVVRGRWLVGRQIARHAHDFTHFDVAYDEYSPDTPLNRIFALTADALWHLTQDSFNRRLLSDLRDWLTNANPQQRDLRADLDRVQFSRLNERFRPAFSLATLFWESRLVQLSAGKSPAFAFVFDMNRLFQDFVSHFLQRHRKRILPAAWKDAEIVLQAAKRRMFLADRIESGQAQGKPVLRIVPDILFTDAMGVSLLIADAKYKRLSPEKPDAGVDQGDVYQLLAYSHRWHCPRILMLYPASSPFRQRFVLKLNPDHEVSIQIAELNLQQPLDQPDALITQLQEAITIH